MKSKILQILILIAVPGSAWCQLTVSPPPAITKITATTAVVGGTGLLGSMTVRTGTSENIAFRHAQDIAAVSGGIGIQSINDAFNVVGTLTIDGRPTIMPTGGLGIGVLTDPGNGNLYLSGTVRYGTNTTGAGSAALGANSPATTNTAPYTWITSKSSDGSTVYIPCWK